jgi:multidrug efflux pump
MRLPELCIRRPVFATVMSLLLTLVGAVAYDRLTVREYPRIEEPVVTVRTDYPGASAEIIESQVTQPLEESLAGIEGIDFMNSISRPEESQITIQFNIDRDPDIASNDVRDRVARARRVLPDDVDEPVVAKREADAQPIIWMSLESDRHSSLELSDAADRIVKDRLQSLPGISEIRIFGERRYAMRVWVDPVRLAAYGLTVQDVETALRAQNVEIPAGRIESSDREFTVLAETDLRSQTAFEDIVLRETGGYPVRISDVGHVKVDAEDKRVAFRINGKSAGSLQGHSPGIARRFREPARRYEAGDRL